jgi:hypothetical protein
MLASQLPDNIEDALAVLRLAKEFVTGFLAGPVYALSEYAGTLCSIVTIANASTRC